MRCLAVAVVLVVTACHSTAKPDGAATGSAATGAPSVAPAVGTGAAVPAAPPPAPTEPTIAQPKRSEADAARVADADHALALAITNAKPAKTRKEACGGIGGLAEKFGGLQSVTPPVGFERAFSEERNSLAMKLDVVQNQLCPDEASADAATVRNELDSLRTNFVRLQHIGAKP